MINGQTNFNGKIEYQMVSHTGANSSDMQVWFGEDKIKVVTVVTKRSEEMTMDDETMIIDFRKSLLYRINDQTKVIRAISLLGKGNRNDTGGLTQTTATTTLAGFKCRMYTSGIQPVGDAPDQYKELMFWYAKDLAYAVPAALANIQMIPAFTNGHIALKTEMKFTAGTFEMKLVTTAVKVQEMAGGVPDSLFVLPQGYTIQNVD